MKNLNKVNLTLIGTLCLLTVHSTFAQSDQGFDLLIVPEIIAATRTTAPSTTNKPGPENTGFTSALVASGSVTVSNAGDIVEGLDIDGCIKVEANNVIIRNVRINCDSFYGIKLSSDSSGTLIEDVEILGMKSAGILGSNFVVRRANIHDSGGDAIKPGSNVLIEKSWFHRLGTTANSHSDGVQMVAGNNVTMRGNNFDMPYYLSEFTNSQCMIIQTNNGLIDDILIEGNWLNGGGYCVQINDKGKGFGAPTNVRIVDNKFGRDCQFGILRFKDSSPILSGNTWEDTGAPIGSDYLACVDR